MQIARNLVFPSSDQSRIAVTIDDELNLSALNFVNPGVNKSALIREVTVQSITSSARANNAGGIVSPSRVAALRLIINS